ncbi:MAG: hypothetical protein AAGJ81_02775 [Verrucomicrobiota bacterium]
MDEARLQILNSQQVLSATTLRNPVTSGGWQITAKTDFGAFIPLERIFETLSITQQI